MLPRVQSLLRTSWVARVTGIWLLSRVLSIGLMLGFAATQGPSGYTGAHPDFISFANFWDARWYAYIAHAGYPAELPLDASGHVTQNSWAFLPVYPLFVGGLSALTQLPWPLVGVLVTLLAGWGFLLVLYRLLRTRLSASETTWSVAFAAFAPAAALLNVAYAEALFLFLLALALLLLVRRQYAVLAVLIPVLALTRPGVIAFALTLAIHAVARWWRRRSEPFGMTERIGVVALGFWTASWGFAWLLLAAAVTGTPDAYLQTELSWRAAYIGWTELPFGTAWFAAANWWWGSPWTVIAPIVAVLVIVGLFTLRATRRLGVDLLAWCASYLIYLFLVFFPQSSTVRILAPLFPLAGVLGQLKSRWLKLSLLAISVAAQAWWLAITWVVVGADWTPP